MHFLCYKHNKRYAANTANLQQEFAFCRVNFNTLTVNYEIIRRLRFFPGCQTTSYLVLTHIKNFENCRGSQRVKVMIFMYKYVPILFSRDCCVAFIVFITLRSKRKKFNVGYSFLFSGAFISCNDAAEQTSNYLVYRLTCTI